MKCLVLSIFKQPTLQGLIPCIQVTAFPHLFRPVVFVFWICIPLYLVLTVCVFLGIMQQGEDQETEDSVEEEGEEDDTESDLVCSDYYLAFS